MRPAKFLTVFAVLIAATLVVSACGAPSTKVTRTLYDKEYKGTRFSNVLVIAVADNYDARAQFERTVSSGIRATGAQATPYYTVIGHNPPVTVNDITNAVRSRKFDAVLFTRVSGSTESIEVKEGAASGKSTVIGGSVIDVFRYDYEEYQEPENVRIGAEVALVTELYAAQDQKKIWVIESSSFDRTSIQQIIDNAAEAIVKKLRSDRLVGPP